MASASGYVGDPRPELSELDRCTRCGLCEQACPTYRLLGFEPDSPRGRVFLMKQVAEGSSGVDAHLAEHLYQCLGCRACETVCPAGVPYGRLLEAARYQIEERGEIEPRRRGWRRFRAIAFEQVLPRPWLFGAVMLPARALQRIPWLLAVAQSSALPHSLSQLVRMIPRNQNRNVGGDWKVAPEERDPKHGSVRIFPAAAQRRARVGLFLGCVMKSLFERVHRATISVLTRNGCDVVIPTNQWCCGALNVHAGERKFAARMATRNIRIFRDLQLDAIIVNSAGCGAVMKEYCDLESADEAGAADFSAKVRDVSEFLCELGLRPGLRPLHARVTYQDACHLAHGQRIRRQPRDLLKQIPGLSFVELRAADQCCGAAGVYSLTHRTLASRILEAKLDDVESAQAQIVATANPGCAMQLQAGLLAREVDARVCHVVELVAESYNSGQ